MAWQRATSGTEEVQMRLKTALEADLEFRFWRAYNSEIRLHFLHLTAYKQFLIAKYTFHI